MSKTGWCIKSPQDGLLVDLFNDDSASSCIDSLVKRYQKTTGHKETWGDMYLVGFRCVEIKIIEIVKEETA